MKIISLIGLLTFSVATLLADTNNIRIPGYTIKAFPNSEVLEAWISFTKPLEVSGYALSNESLQKPLHISILRYASSEEARKAFKTSWRGRPQAPKDLTVRNWEAAHRWTSDMYLLKGVYLVGLYQLPSDFSAEQLDKLLQSLAGNLIQSNPIPAENTSALDSGKSQKD